MHLKKISIVIVVRVSEVRIGRSCLETEAESGSTKKASIASHVLPFI
jgi:hypothetical protein